MYRHMAGRRTSSVVDSHISRLWEGLLRQAGHKDPTRTLLPIDGPDAAEIEALEPNRDSANVSRRVKTPLPLEGTDDLLGTGSHSEFARRYRIFGRLDEGGMGCVYLAWHHALAREVAVKVLLKDDSTTRRLLFRAEALVTAYLEHPNIVPVYDAADHCLVMRHIRGASLDRLLAAGAELPRVVEILLKVCDAIAFAHSRGIIHRDIKAENVMVGEYGEVLVVDWGLACAVKTDHEGVWRAPRLDRMPSVCAGTPACLPPEIARGDRPQVGTASDVHMLGGLIYHVLTGRLPFESEDTESSLLLAASNDFPALAKLAPDSPTRLIKLSTQAMTLRPEERPSLQHLINELHAWLVRVDARTADETGTYRPIERRPPTGWLHRLISR